MPPGSKYLTALQFHKRKCSHNLVGRIFVIGIWTHFALSNGLCCGYTPLHATNTAISRAMSINARSINARPTFRTIKVAHWRPPRTEILPNFAENQWQWVAWSLQPGTGIFHRRGIPRHPYASVAALLQAKSGAAAARQRDRRQLRPVSGLTARPRSPDAYQLRGYC
jgi:hypothetical protein